MGKHGVGSRGRPVMSYMKGETSVTIAAWMLDCSPRTVRNLIKTNLIEARRNPLSPHRLFSHYIVNIESVRQYADINRQIVKDPEDYIPPKSKIKAATAPKNRWLSEFIHTNYAAAFQRLKIQGIESVKPISKMWIRYKQENGHPALHSIARANAVAESSVLGTKAFVIAVIEGVVDVRIGLRGGVNQPQFQKEFARLLSVVIAEIEAKKKENKKRQRIRRKQAVKRLS